MVNFTISVSYSRPVETLIDCLLLVGTERRERSGTVDMVVAALQKLSLKWPIRKKMIERGIVEWLADYISDSSTDPEQTPYALEYSTALFMNLCLHR